MNVYGIRLTKLQWVGVIFVVSVAARLALAWIMYSPQYVYTGEAEWIGKSIAMHGEFSGAYAIPTGPTAHCGPFYGLMAALSLLSRWTPLKQQPLSRVVAYGVL